MSEKRYEVLNTTTPYNGFFRLTCYTLRHTLHEGGWSEVMTRELFERGSCVGVVLYDAERDQVVLLEQFRVGALQSTISPWLIEIVAGAIEEGESPEEVAYREAEEEAGCQIEKLIRIGEFFTSPGGASEKITLFCGLIDASTVGGVCGLKEEHEDILVSVVSFDEAYALLEAGKVESAIPIIGLQWLALNRHKIL